MNLTDEGTPVSQGSAWSIGDILCGQPNIGTICHGGGVVAPAGNASATINSVAREAIFWQGAHTSDMDTTGNTSIANGDVGSAWVVVATGEGEGHNPTSLSGNTDRGE